MKTAISWSSALTAEASAVEMVSHSGMSLAFALGYPVKITIVTKDKVEASDCRVEAS